MLNRSVTFWKTLESERKKIFKQPEGNNVNKAKQVKSFQLKLRLLATLIILELPSLNIYRHEVFHLNAYRI